MDGVTNGITSGDHPVGHDVGAAVSGGGERELTGRVEPVLRIGVGELLGRGEVAGVGRGEVHNGISRVLLGGVTLIKKVSRKGRKRVVVRSRQVT